VSRGDSALPAPSGNVQRALVCSSTISPGAAQDPRPVRPENAIRPNWDTSWSDELPQKAGNLPAVTAQCTTLASHRCEFSALGAEGNQGTQRFQPRCARSGRATVPMMQTTDLWNSDDAAGAGGFDLSLDRRISVQRQVGSGIQVVLKVGLQDAPQVSFVDHDDVIEALPTDRTDEAFAIGILPRRSWSDEYFLDAHILDAVLEHIAADAIAMTNQESRHLIEWERFNDLLRRPFRRGMSGDVEVRDLSPIVPQDDEGEKYAKCRRGDGKEVDRDDISNMVVKEGSPRRRGRFARVDSVLVHGRCGDDVAEERKLGLDAWRTPRRILTRHALNQFANFRFDSRASGFPSRLPAPEQLEALLVPSNHGVRLDNEENGTPIGPDSGHQRPEDPIPLAQPRCF